ncbi:MAG: NifU family protein [candidate division WOR-3 bacterium]
MNEEIKKNIKETFEKEIRPGLMADGGDGEIVEITDDGIVKVKLLGSCASCPFATLTLALGIEQRLKEKFPEVKKVENII